MGRPSALVLVLALMSAGLAGCLGGPEQGPAAPTGNETDGPDSLANLSRPVFDAIQRSEHVIQGEAQGEETEEIWLDVYRPADAEHPVPVILVMTPYQSLGDALAVASALEDGQGPALPPSQEPYDEQLVEFFVPRGYAVAFADVRGNHNSGGCIDQSGPEQWRDGYYTVEWLAEQAWSNGNVGMYGVSYDGETQITTALLSPPSLKTIVPIASVDSQYAYLHYDGVPYELQGAGTMAGYLAISAVPGTHPNAVETYPERFTCQPDNLERALDLSGDWNDYWDDRAYWKRAEQANTSMLRVHGLQDWNVKPDHIDPSTQRWGGQTVRELYGQWPHATPDRPDWGEDGGILHQWFDHFLYEHDTGIVDALPPVLVEDTQERWHALDVSGLVAPSASTANASNDSGSPDGVDEAAPTLRFMLDADGKLATENASHGQATIRDYPRGGQGSGLDGASDPLVSGAGEQADAPARLVFETPRLQTEHVFVGRPTLTFNASTDQQSTHWVAHLERVTEDGESEWINRGYQDTRHRHGLEDPQPLEPGENYQLTIEMFPQADVLHPGEKLRLVLTNQDGWVHQDTTYAQSIVELGPTAVLEMPVLPNDARQVEEDAFGFGDRATEER